MTDREARLEALSKVPAVTLGFWIIKILATTLGETGGDTVTMTWLGETTAHPVPNGYLIGTAIFGVLLIALVVGADPGAALQPVALLGDHRRLDHLRHDARRLRRPLARHRLSGRVAAAARLRAALAVRVVADARHHRRQHRRRRRAPRPSTGSPSPSRRRSAPRSATGSPMPALAIRAARWCSARRWRSSPCSISRPASATSSCSGRRSSSPARSARRSATSSTSRSPRAAWNSAGRSPRRCWPPSSSR